VRLGKAPFTPTHTALLRIAAIHPTPLLTMHFNPTCPSPTPPPPNSCVRGELAVAIRLGEPVQERECLVREGVQPAEGLFHGEQLVTGAKAKRKVSAGETTCKGRVYRGRVQPAEKLLDGKQLT
jgi:hypothetical protein